MAQPQTVNFFAPGTEAGLDYSQVQRQRALAELLTRQGQTPQQGSMAGNIYVPPSALSYVTQLANALGGGYMQRKADDSERDILQQAQARRTQEANDFMQAVNGAPGRPVAQPVANDDEGNPLPPAIGPATAPDRARAIAIAMQSQNPALQGMGGKLMEQQMAEQQLTDIMGRFGGGAPAGGAAGAGGASSAPAAGGQGAAPAGGIPGVNPLAFALTGSGNPTFGKLGSMIQEASKPQALAEGGTLVTQDGRPIFTAPKTEAGIGVRNGMAAPIPGFAEAQARREALQAQARQQAESANTMVTVDVGGKPVQMTRQQFLEMTNRGQAPALPGAGYANEGQMRGTASGDMGADPAALNREISALQSDLGKVKDAPSKAMIQQEIDRLTAMRPRANQPAPAAPGIVGQSSGEKAYGDARAKDFAEQASGFQKGGQQGSSTLRNIDQLRTLYADPNVAKGALAENISGLKNLGASFGIDMKGLSSEQASEAITNKMALDMRSTADGGGMPGAMSDADRNFLKALTPNLTKSPEGRAKIMDAQQKVAQRQIDVARLANEYEQRNGRLDAGFDRVLQDYAAKNRMFTQAQAGGGSKTNIDALLNKYR